MMITLPPVIGPFETHFQKEAFKVLQQALLESGVPVLLNEPNWEKSDRWNDREKILPEALSKIGKLYYDQAIE